jgi:hypothetical protein
MPKTAQTSLVGLLHSIRFPAVRPRLVASPNWTAKRLFSPQCTLKALGFKLPTISNYTRAASYSISTLGPQGRDPEEPNENEELGESLGQITCHLCKSVPAVHMTAIGKKNRRGNGTNNVAYCDPCWRKHHDIQKRKKGKRERRASQKPIRDPTVKEMLKKVMSIEVTGSVPLLYAATKFMEQTGAHKKHHNPAWYKWQLNTHLLEELEIVKVGKQNFCNKARVDAMDFKLWWKSWLR